MSEAQSKKRQTRAKTVKNSIKTPKKQVKSAKKGRKSKYLTHVEPKLNQIKEWAFSGYTDEEIWRSLRIGRDSYYRYLKEFSEFSEALKEGKSFSNFQAAQTLYKKAMGFHEETEKPFQDGTVVKYKHYYPPDHSSLVVWLYNRWPELWKAKPLSQSSVTSAIRQIREIWTDLEKENKDLIEIAREFEKYGQPIPESIRMELTAVIAAKIEKEAESPGDAGSFDYDDLERDAKEREKETEEQVTEFVPKRKAELAEIKEEIGLGEKQMNQPDSGELDQGGSE